MATTAVVSSKGQMVIPAKLRAQLGIKPGTRLSLTVENGRLIAQSTTMEEILALCGKYAGLPLEEDLREDRRREREREERRLAEL